jgi:hypothetical protein
MSLCEHGRFQCGECRAERLAAEEALRVERAAQHADWYDRSGHCGLCGAPGDWCQCTDRDPCGCRELHVMGSGIGRNPADVFAVDAPAEVEQQGLF